MLKFRLPLLALLLLSSPGQAQSSGAPLSPPELWKSYNPDQGPFHEEIVREETANGIYSRDSYISAYVAGEEVRVYCCYRVKAGASNAPGLLDVHGWMGMPTVSTEYVNDGWAVMAHDYCGKKDNRTHYSKYPEKLAHGRMEANTIHAKLPDGKEITDPNQTSHYLWYAIERRVLSYLLAQKEVDKNRIGAKGYSYGGTLMWNLGMDSRVKAVVSYFGIGWIAYYRDRGVWMYDPNTRQPPMSDGEKLFIHTVEAQSHAPYISAPTLWLTGSNDHHSGHERGGETFKLFKPSVPWSFAIQARGHHNTEKLGDDAKLWLEKYVLGKNTPWPARPQAELTLDRTGVPQVQVTPDSPNSLKELQVFYAQKEPNNVNRSWREASTVRTGNTWTATLPVLNTDDYVFAFSNAHYENNIVVSSDFKAAIPSKLGNAVATDKLTDVIPWANNAWTDTVPAKTPGGIEGFRTTNKKTGTRNQQMNDPAWRAKPNSALSIRFHSKEAQKFYVSANNQFDMNLELKPSGDPQTIVISAKNLRNRTTSQPMQDWMKATDLLLMPAAGIDSDITQVVFLELKWVPEQP
jgi:dienelactone hydrolase